ncbi:MAG TPA: hypothetical protein VM510_10185 [Caulifigura sp.]|nr:hypothetical protein [Caulifigura sp.]
MNKAFVREPDFERNTYCPRCGTIALHVWSGPLDTHVRAESRGKLADDAWYCPSAACDVAYFQPDGAVVEVAELNSEVYPYDLDAPICACFGLTYDDVAADVAEGTPTRLRELLAKSKSPAARCATIAVDGRCCMPVVQELYMRLKAKG